MPDPLSGSTERVWRVVDAKGRPVLYFEGLSEREAREAAARWNNAPFKKERGPFRVQSAPVIREWSDA